ncbi:MAG TPA: GNAT family N-acetyltransferase [Pyrinomonadaceae bacterium]|nr:GNAT family N-acetyltransferase [Pyrinomonadaceae bacterium]
MINYRLLSDHDFESLYVCFLAAFSDYEVDMQMSREQFRQRIVRDGVRMEMSAGAFDPNQQMIGFCINGVGTWQGTETAYDAGTGVVREYRGRGVGKELFAFLTPRLRDKGIKQYLLEVLKTNTPAASLYRKLGFMDTRQLAVFRSFTRIGNSSDASVRQIQQPDWNLYRSFWDGYPSWQNSIDAVERIATDTMIAAAYLNDECVGYGIVFTPSANLMQLAVSPRHRRKGIGSAILAALEPPERLKINNIDEQLTNALEFYKANGYKQVLDQYEMMKTLE